MTMTTKPFQYGLAWTLALLLLAVASFFPASVRAGIVESSSAQPSLIISDAPIPKDLQDKVYRVKEPVPDVSPSDLMGDSYYTPTETIVGRKVEELRRDLSDLQGKIAGLSERLTTLETDGQAKAADYYASVATISTQLQAGTTPGNPRLVERLNTAQGSLETLAGNVTQLNSLAVEVANVASLSSFLLEATRASYGLSGAVEEDHARLAQLEDSVNNTIVVIDRILNNVNDDISRTAAYLSSERSNLRTLSLAITTGDLFGKSLSNRPFSGLSNMSPAAMAPAAGGPMPVTPVSATPLPVSAGAAAPTLSPPGRTGSPRPLVKIRFDRPDVAYEQPVYMAVNEALERYPQARFELVAVHPSTGNAAQIAIESSRARRSAERVLRTLTEMGLPMDRVDLSYTPSPEAKSSEVHIYIRSPS
ncbi:MAG TPA: hypothetical protein PKX87_02270 [Alphaproteobacteria bacterium]|nr:hypothetical protein [Alphaproteobacteria bacterium]